MNNTSHSADEKRIVRMIRVAFAPLALLAALGLCLLAAAPRAQAQAMEGVAAIVNDEVITTYDLRQRVRLILTSSGVEPTPELLQRAQSQALRGLIDERVQLQEAAEFDIAVSPDEVNAAIDRLARQNNVTADAIQRDLAQVGVDVRTLEDQLRAEIAWRSLMNGLYGSRVRVSDDQISQALERMAASASKDQYRMAEILVEPRITPQGEDVSMQDVQYVYQILQQSQGRAFAELARRVSAAPSAVNGGDVGWVSAGDLRHEALERELAGMRPGAISQPVQTREGIYIVLLIEKREGADLERVRLRQLLLSTTQAGGRDAQEEAARQLNDATRRMRACDDVARVKRSLPRVIASDLGLVTPRDLSPSIRAAVEALEPGQTSEAILVPAGAIALSLCERVDMTPESLPSRAEVENQLIDRQISLLSRRYLRDLIDTATIENRLR